MANNTIVVPGYSQKIFYNNGIEYRNFNSLDPFVQSDSSGESVYSNGIFNVTTNIAPKLSILFNSGKLSPFYSLSTLNITQDQISQFLPNNKVAKLNLDPTKLSNYALFGSAVEYLRVSLQNIITNWPASLYANRFFQSTTGYTVQNYIYDNTTDTSSFIVNTNYINNNYGINYLSNGILLSNYSSSTLSNNSNIGGVNYKTLASYYNYYNISYNSNEYPLLGFTGSTSTFNDYLYFTVQGNPFNNGSNSVNYHILPNAFVRESYFNQLSELESWLLNRKSNPAYTSIFNFDAVSDSGIIVNQNQILSWPVSDGYNIDYNSTLYSSYASNLLDLFTHQDSIDSDLIVRFLTSEAITSFDSINFSTDSAFESQQGRMTSMLHVFGRNYDELNRYIEGIQFVNNVTYDKKDNAPDNIILNLARTFGWTLTNSMQNNDMLANYVTANTSSYLGWTIGHTIAESEIEFWRRQIINSPWLFKNKGTRSPIEYLLRSVGIPDGLCSFNEYVYVAKQPLDVNLIQQILLQVSGTTDISNLSIDNNGFPQPQSQNKIYFEQSGLWHEQTGGIDAVVHNSRGNNPHYGPYDMGSSYMDQFINLIPNFTGITLTDTVVVSGTTNLYSNYNDGSFDFLPNDLNTTTYEYVVDPLTNQQTNCVEITTSVDVNPYSTDILTDCGCVLGTSNRCLSIKVNCNPGIEKGGCPYTSAESLSNGLVQFYFTDGSNTIFLDDVHQIGDECCILLGKIPLNQMIDGKLRRVCSWNNGKG